MATIDQSWYTKTPGIKEHHAAGGIVIRKEKDDLYLATTKEIDTDMLVLPKGHVEKNEDYEKTARREIEEETGLADLKLFKYLGTKERLNFGKTSWKITHYYLFLTKQKGGLPTDPRHQPVRWIKLSEYTKHLWPEQKDLIRENLKEIENLKLI